MYYRDAIFAEKTDVTATSHTIVKYRFAKKNYINLTDSNKNDIFTKMTR